MTFFRMFFQVALSISFTFTAASAFAGEPAINTLGKSPGFLSSPKPTGLAIRGADTVAYFTEGKYVAGNSSHTTDWNGAKWQFSSKENLEKFKAEPTKYAPQYGGYCAYGVTKGYLVKVEPDQFTVLDGKLYLNYDADVQKDWSKDKAGYIKKADSKFASLLK